MGSREKIVQHRQRSLALITLPLAITTTLCVEASINSAEAQLVPDDTLGAESSIVTPDVEINGIPSDRIDGGATRGANLFHSFQDFQVGEGRGAYFANPAAIENILSRVTGSNLSQILGTLGVLGNANLFFINPNGIVFGPNARLDVRGSFVGSTADSLVFENGFEFSATNPQAPPLLTINIPIGLRFRESPGNLVNQSVATNNIGESVGLQVQPESTLALVGGDVAIESGGLTAPDGQIELGSLAGNNLVSVAGNNLVSLTLTDTGYALGYEGVENFQNIRLSQGAFVNTSGNGGGRIQVQGSNVTLSDESFMFADTEGSGNGGGVSLKASQLTLLGGSLITADVLGSGPGGNLTIETGQLRISDSADVTADTSGKGNAGNILVQAHDSVEVTGEGSFLSAEVLEDTTGDGGNLTIETGQLLVSNGAKVSASTLGEGAGGSLTVNATESVQVIGGKFASFLAAQAQGKGNAGNLTISTPTLLITDDAQVSASTFAEGAGGSLTVNATESVQVIGRSALGAQAEGKGNAGDLTISTPTLLITDGAQVSAGTFGEGAGGNLVVEASESVQLIGTTADGQFPSGLFAGTVGAGDGGNLTLTTGQLLVSDGAEVGANTFAEGAGGNLVVEASESVQLIGTSADGQLGSGLGAQAEGKGNAGDLTISTPTLLITDGAKVSAGTLGEGAGGNLVVDVSESVQLIGTTADGQFGSGLLASSEGAGDAGDLTLTTGKLIVRDGARVAVSSQGEGIGGNIEILSGSLTLDNQASLSAATASEDGGNITLTLDDLLVLQRGSEISASAGLNQGRGNGGNIALDADFIVAFPRDNKITANAFRGRGGNININTNNIFGLTDFLEIDASSQFGLAGTVEISTPDADPSRGLVELPENVVNPEDLIAQNACRQGARSEFTITGRGGLPSTPEQVQNSDEVEVGLVEPALDSAAPVTPPPVSAAVEEIVPARGWIRNEKGEVVLVGYDPTASGVQRQERNLGTCQPR
jgi:filamentous hemagglutinin family protein